MSTESGAEISYYMEYIRCQKSNCIRCQKTNGHGPYWFASLVSGNETRRMYVGKVFRSLSVEDFYKGHFLEQEVEKQPEDFQKSDKMKFGSLFTRKKTKLEQMISSPIQTPPTRNEFERDVLGMKKMPHRPALKAKYRQLIKKYHPDKFPDKKEMNHWMAEINSQFQEQWKRSL